MGLLERLARRRQRRSNGANAVVIYADGGAGHPGDSKGSRKNPGRSGQEKSWESVSCTIRASRFRAPTAGPQFLEWVGGYYEHMYSVKPDLVAGFSIVPEASHQRAAFKPFSTKDEWYFNIRWRTSALELAALNDLPAGARRGPNGCATDLYFPAGKERCGIACRQKPQAEPNGSCSIGDHPRFLIAKPSDEVRKKALTSYPKGPLPSHRGSEADARRR